MTSPLDLEALKAAAEAATPGKWKAFPFYYETGDGAGKRLIGPGPFDTIAEVRMGHDDIAGTVDANAAFIALANPAFIKAILSDRARLLALIAEKPGHG